MKIGGLQKTSLVDYPGKVVATVFLIGCNFRCPFCQNPELVVLDKIKDQPLIDEKEFFEFLEQRKGLLEGVCITGGEPTIQKELLDFIKTIKNMGFLVKLDTNGSNPEILKKLIKKHLLDYIAMDIKTPFSVNYDKATGIKTNLKKIKESIETIKNSGIDYEFRMTIVPTIIDKNSIEEIGKFLEGVEKFAIQQFQNKKVLNKKFEKIEPYTKEVLEGFKSILEKHAKRVELRL